MGMIGLEPMTSGLKARCSAIELHTHLVHYKAHENSGHRQPETTTQVVYRRKINQTKVSVP
jgi:hypothetical protein